MKTYERVLLFFVLPVIAPLLFPPGELSGMVPDVLLGTVIAVVALLIGYFLWRGYSLALSFGIFLQGFNVITRMMMFLSGAVDRSSAGVALVHYPFIILSVVSIGVSLWLLLRLDRNDVHGQMIA